jgi:hypothetical protein
MPETALIFPVPEAEALVSRLREKYDPSAAVGVPAHVTILYPFLAPDAVGAGDVAALTTLFASAPPVRTEIFDMGCAPRQGVENVATMAFTERAGRTIMTITVLYPSKEVRDGMLASGMERGMAAGYAQLDEMLASPAKNR